MLWIIDRGVNTFSPEGRLFQGETPQIFPLVSCARVAHSILRIVEYAIEAIKVSIAHESDTTVTTKHHDNIQLGSTTVGIRTPEGVVLGVEKRVQSPLLESSSIEKIMEIDSHLGCAMSG